MGLKVLTVDTKLSCQKVSEVLGVALVTIVARVVVVLPHHQERLLLRQRKRYINQPHRKWVRASPFFTGLT